MAANRLISNSLNIVPSLVLIVPSFPTIFGRDTSKTKNQAVKNVPIASNTVAKCGNTAGLMGEIYLVIDSMVLEKLGRRK